MTTYPNQIIKGIQRRLHRNETVRSTVNRLRYTPGLSTPVFVVGCGRSGTTMTVRVLARSWEVTVYNETSPEAFENFHLREFSVLDALLGKSRARATVFKPILDTHLAPLLLSNYESSRVLFIYRHYPDAINSLLKHAIRAGVESRLKVVESWVRTDFSGFDKLQIPAATREYIGLRFRKTLSEESGAALYWLFWNRLFFDLGLQENNRVQLVGYEKLVTHPEKEIESLCRFLGINFRRFQAEGIFSSSIGLDPPPTLDPDILEDCEEVWRALRKVDAGASESKKKLGSV